MLFSRQIQYKAFKAENHYFREDKSKVKEMNYYLPRYDVPLVLGYTGPGLFSYSPGSEETGDLIPSFSKEDNILAGSKSLQSQTAGDNNDLINTFFSDKVAMMRATIENIVSQIEERKRIKERNTITIRRDMFECESHLLETEALLNSVYSHGPNMGRRRTTLDGQLFSLKKDLRSEELNYWRDLVFLKKEFMETLNGYQAAKKRKELASPIYLASLEEKVKENERN